MKNKKSSLQPPSLLLWKMAFEFETPLTFDQCVDKLELLKSLEGNAPMQRVELISRSEQRMQFKFEDDRSWLGNGWTLGEVQSFEGRPLNLVSGKIGITAGVGFYAPFLLTILICPLLLCFQLIGGLTPLMIIPVVIVLLYGAFFYLALRLRRKLYEDLKGLFDGEQQRSANFVKSEDESENVENELSDTSSYGNAARR